MTFVLAASGGAVIFAVIIVLFVFGLAYTVYTRSGSGISDHPSRGEGSDQPAGSAGLEAADQEEFRERFSDGGSR